MSALSRCACPDTCPYITTCENKVMFHEGYLEPVAVKCTQPLREPLLRQTTEINVYGEKMTVYKDDLERMINELLTGSLMLRNTI